MKSAIVDRVENDRSVYGGLLLAGLLGQTVLWYQLLSFDPRALSRGLAADAVFLLAALPLATLSVCDGVVVWRRVRTHPQYHSWSRHTRFTAWTAAVAESRRRVAVYLQVLAFTGVFGTFYGLFTTSVVTIVLAPLLALVSFVVGSAVARLHRFTGDPR